MKSIAKSRHLITSVSWVFVAVTALAVDRAHASDVSKNCDAGVEASSYRQADGDIGTERSLEITRPYSGKGKLTVTVCAGNLRILPTLDGQLHLKVDVENRPHNSMESLVRKVEVKNGSAEVSLAYPKDLHPTITLRVPTDYQSLSEIELGVGTISLRGDALHGYRELNVGSGRIKLFLREDTEYSQLLTNVGMGNLHDRRPRRRSMHLSASRTEQGRGSGKIVALVGLGSIELSPEE